MWRAVAFLLPVLLVSMVTTDDKVVVMNENKFEYEYKILQKLVQLEEGQKKLEVKLTKKENEIEHLTEELKEAHTSIETLNEVIDVMESQGSGEGDTYVRWGRTSCPDNGAQLVYEGYVGGSHYTHTGAAVNHLCLPKDPLWGPYTDGLQDDRALVYGAEYETTNQLPGRHNHDVPCAVCKTFRTPVLMIPGRNDCYPGWTLEYKGLLSAGYYKHVAASEFVCLDGAPETVEGGDTDQNGILFYTTEGRCGSLKCPPYVNGRELSCAVCSFEPYPKSRDSKKRHWSMDKET